MKRNLLNFPKKDFDISIYRVFSVHRFFEMIESDLLTLVKPEKWDDPLENFIINTINEVSQNSHILGDSRDTFFGQCWTTQRENDALWRIYAPNKDGVIVSTTPRRLMRAILVHPEMENSFIGKVQYFEKHPLYSKWAEPEVIRNIVNNRNPQVMAKTLLMKLLAFKHEAEVRLLVYKKRDNSDFLLKIPINSKSLFSKITFDPRMSKNEYLKNKKKLKSLGYKKDIGKSNLYTLHEMHFDKSKITQLSHK